MGAAVKRRVAGRAVSLALAALMAVSAPPSAQALSDDEFFLLLFNPFWYFLFHIQGTITLSDAADGVGEGVFVSNNFGGGLEPGEPDEGGTMHSTIWGQLALPEKKRVVMFTAASEFDTVLAVYRGTRFENFVRVTGNDDTPIPGLSTTQSLLQFDAQPDKQYRVQIGSKTGDEGDVYVNAFAFPPAGGLAAVLTSIGGFNYHGRDYTCGFGTNFLSPCGSPKFILHNSTESSVTVTSSHDLGDGITAPAPVTIPAGQFRTVDFLFTSGFDKATVRTVSGAFSFTAKTGNKVVGSAAYRALIMVKEQGNAPDVLSASIVNQAGAGYINEDVPCDVTLKNNGALPAVGCHAHSEATSVRARTLWQRIDPASGEPIGQAGEPFSIPAGASRSMRVLVRSQRSRIAFGEVRPAIVECANTGPLTPDQSNAFDFTARGSYDPASVSAEDLAPRKDVLDVPAGGTASFRIAAANVRGAYSLKATPRYEAPEAGDPARRFTVSICRMNKANGACLEPPAKSVDYELATDEEAFLKIDVTAPDTDPGFDPKLRRVFVDFTQKRPKRGLGVTTVPVGSTSIAVRRN